MPKFGQCKFHEDRFGKIPSKGRWFYQRTYRGRYLGDEVNGTVGLYYIAGVLQTDKAITYRNVKGVQYKYKYDPPWPSGNPAAGTARAALIQAMLNWKTFSAEQKAPYIEAAAKESWPNGYNAYVKEYVEANA